MTGRSQGLRPGTGHTTDLNEKAIVALYHNIICKKNAYEKQNLCEDTHIRVTSTPHLGSLPPAPIGDERRWLFGTSFSFKQSDRLIMRHHL